MRLETREVQILGITDQLCESWMKQMARNLTDPVDGFLRDIRYLIMDRDPLFTSFSRSLAAMVSSCHEGRTGKGSLIVLTK
jgi:hypothetical protein